MAKGIDHASVGTILTQAEWESTTAHVLASGTSFPGSPSEGDLFYRTDEHLWYIHNGTTWIKTIVTLVAGDIPDISATYSVKAGNTSLVTVGTITTGHWHGDAIDEAKVPTTYASEITFSAGIRIGDIKFKNGWRLTEDGKGIALVKGRKRVKLV